MTNINLSKDLARLSIAERLNIMMHYRAAEFLQQPTPISELEYNTIDTSIKSGDEARAYNKAHHAYMDLQYQFEFVVKCVIRVELHASYFKTLWIANRQAAYILDGIDYFMYLLQQELGLSNKQQTKVIDLMTKSLNEAVVLFNTYEKVVSSDKSEYIEAKFRMPKHFQENVDDLNKLIENVQSQIEEYKQIEVAKNLTLTPFNQLLPSLLQEAEIQRKWLDKRT